MRNFVKEKEREVKVRRRRVKVKVHGLRGESRMIERQREDQQPPLDFVRDNFGNAGDIAGALVVSQYIMRDVLLHFKLRIVLLATDYVRRASLLDTTDHQEWCDTMRAISLSASLTLRISLYRILSSSNYIIEFKDNTLFR